MSLQLYFAKRCRSSVIAEAEDLGAAAGTHCHAYKKAAVVIIVCYGAVMGIRAIKMALSNAARIF